MGRAAGAPAIVRVDLYPVGAFANLLAHHATQPIDAVGKVAQRNFFLVRDKVRGIVLRADIGITTQAWEVREEELERVRSLQTERARQEQVLDEELKEVLDDSVDPGASGGGGTTPK